MEIIKKIRACKNCELCNLEINECKPLDINRFSKKLVFVGQNPSFNREKCEKIFEYSNKSDNIMLNFFELLSIDRDSVYFTNVVKCSTIDNSVPNRDCFEKCIEYFYEEMNVIKPYIIVFVSMKSSEFIDINRIKCPIIILKHPSYYFRNTGNIEKSAFLMFNDLVKQCVCDDISYNFLLNFKDKKCFFKNVNYMKLFFNNINSLKIYNISIDANFKIVGIFISNFKVFRVQIIYNNYCWIECDIKEREKFTLFNNPCKKVFYHSFKDLKNDIVYYEKDIHEDYRFIIDYFDYFECIKKEELNYLTFDIETNKSVDVINTPGEIISIVYLLNDKYEFLFLDNKNDNFNCIKEKSDVKIFVSEKEMIEYFINIFRCSNIITGFNIYGFDLIYLLNRAKKLGINENTYSPINRIKNNVREEKDRMDSRNIEIYGVDCIDTMYYAKDKFFIYSLEKPSQYNLDYLGNYLKLGEKIKDSRGPSELWLNDPEKLYEYNIQDVRLCRQIEDYMGMIHYLLSFKSLMSTFNLKWSLFNSKIIDFFILCNYSRKYVFPSKKDNVQQELEGGFVLDTIPKIYNDVAIFDFASLYPNLIRQFNISYETVSEKNEFEKSVNLNNKYYVDISKKAFLSEVIDTLMIMKNDYGKKFKDSGLPIDLVKYNSIKAVINGVYGVFAYRYFRMYNIAVANSITLFGRTIIQELIKRVNKISGFKVIASDTDSIFVHNFNGSYFDELEKKLDIEVDNICKELYNIDNKYLKIECETIFYRLLMSRAKKKYYGLAYFLKGKKYNELKTYGRGIDLVKKDTPVILRPILKQMLIDIVMSNSDNDIKNTILKTKKLIFQLSYRDLLITKQISREIEEYKVKPQHVRAMQYSNIYLNGNFSRANYKGGMLYVKVKSKFPFTEVVMLNDDIELPNEIVCDYKKYYDLFVKNKICLFMDDFEKFFNENYVLHSFDKSIGSDSNVV